MAWCLRVEPDECIVYRIAQVPTKQCVCSASPTLRNQTRENQHMKFLPKPLKTLGDATVPSSSQDITDFFKRVVARRAVYHTLDVITISLYVRPSVRMCKAGLTRGVGGLDPLWLKSGSRKEFSKW